MSMHGRRGVVISGAAQGIGAAIAHRLCNDGYAVALFDIKPCAPAPSVNGDMESAGQVRAAAFSEFRQNVGDSLWISHIIDISSEAAVTNAARDVLTQWEAAGITPYGVINNAGITADGLAIRQERASWERLFAINVTGAFFLTKAFLPALIREREGRIISIGSVVGMHGNGGQSAYAASKAALHAYTQSLASEYGARGITANVIAPGYIDTALTASLSEEYREKIRERTALKRLGTPADITGWVSFLLSPESGYCTGQIITVDGLL